MARKIKKPTTAADRHELAAALDVTEHAVRAWTQRYDWPFSKRGPFPIARVRRWRAENLNEPRGGRWAVRKEAELPPVPAVVEAEAVAAEDSPLIALAVAEVVRLNLLIRRLVEDRQTRPGCWCDMAGGVHSADCIALAAAMAASRELFTDSPGGA